MIKKKICIILCSLLALLAVITAFAGDGIIFNDLKPFMTIDKASYAGSITVCGIDLPSGYWLDDELTRYNADEEELPKECYAYYCEGTLELNNFNVGGDEQQFATGINAGDKDLDIVVEDNNTIDIASPSDGIVCRNLTFTGDSGSLRIANDEFGEDPESAGIRCNSFFLNDIEGSSERMIQIESCGYGIKCNHFIMYQCDDDRIDISSAKEGIYCDNFTIYTENQCFVKIDAGNADKKIYADGIHSTGAIYVESYNVAGGSKEDDDEEEKKAGSTLLIESESIGISAGTDITITSGVLNITGDGTAAIKAEGKLTLDIRDHESDLPDESIQVKIEGFDVGLSGNEVLIDGAEDSPVELLSISETGIAADKIIINHGDITIDAGDTAMFTSNEGDLYIGPFMRIDAGECEGEEEPVEEYGGEPFAHLFHCPHDRVAYVEGCEPTYFADGLRSCYRCEDCKRYYEDEACEHVIKNYEKWKKNSGRIPKLKIPENKSAIPVPANTGTPDNPVRLGEGNWTVDENGVWTFRTNAPFRNTWGYIELPSAVEGEPPKASWFFFSDDYKMLVGWQFINGKWYYLNEEHDGTYGACQLGGVTKDGYILDENGAWTGERIAQ